MAKKGSGRSVGFRVTALEMAAARAEVIRRAAARVTHAFLSIRYYMAGAKRGRAAGEVGGYGCAAWQLGAVAAWRKIAAEALAEWRRLTGFTRFLLASPVREGVA